MDKRVSIIIPVYKAEKYVHEAIDSVIEQDYVQKELLLIYQIHLLHILYKANHILVPVAETTKVGEVDDATRTRVEGYMDQFEMIYDIVVREFGEKNAPSVMDLVMDKLMGMDA